MLFTLMYVGLKLQPNPKISGVHQSWVFEDTLNAKPRAWSGYCEAVRARNSQGVKVGVDKYSKCPPQSGSGAMFCTPEVKSGKSPFGDYIEC